MAEIAALFWDIGGVLLTNAWDREQRLEAAREFVIDPKDFEERHELVVAGFETGTMPLDEYLDHTLFCRSCPFSRDSFKKFMLAQSKPFPEIIAIARELAATRRYFMATLNNESRELNQYRIRNFGLDQIFQVFFSSCYLGVQKPDKAIYRYALDLSQVPPERCLFIDDRPLNLEVAKQMGMNVIQRKDAVQLRSDLRMLGLPVAEAAAAQVS